MSVLIGGGSGFVGRHLTRLLIERSMAVTWVSRSEGPGRITWPDLQKDGLPEGCTAVVSMSGESGLFLPFQKWDVDLMKATYTSRVDCTKSLSDAISNAKKPPKVFVCMSAVTYYKPKFDVEHDEDSPGGSFDFMSELCTHWESASKLPPNVNCRQVIIRSGIVLGDGGIVKNIYWPFFLGLGGHAGSGKQWFPWIHVADLAGIITYAIENEDVSGIYNGVAPETTSNAAFAKSFAAALNRPAVIPFSEAIMKILFSPEMAKIVLEGQKVIPKRTLMSGYKFAFPDLESACQDLPKMLNMKSTPQS